MFDVPWSDEPSNRDLAPARQKATEFYMLRIVAERESLLGGVHPVNDEDPRLFLSGAADSGQNFAPDQAAEGLDQRPAREKTAGASRRRRTARELWVRKQ
jgi:hypothetical protein